MFTRVICLVVIHRFRAINSSWACSRKRRPSASVSSGFKRSVQVNSSAVCYFCHCYLRGIWMINMSSATTSRGWFRAQWCALSGWHFFCMAQKILQFISVFCLFGLLFVVCVHLCQLLVTDWCPSAGKAICSKFYYLLSICCVQLLYLFLYASWWHDSVVRTLVFGRRTFPDFCQIHGWRVTTLWVNYGSGNSVRTQPSIPLGLANE